jgi:SAM-dependent methyltransferase
MGDTPWEKGAPAPPFLEWLQVRGPLHGTVLVPGCRYGHDVRAIAAAAPDAKVVGIDISPLAVGRARQFPVAGQEVYQLGDLFNLSQEYLGEFQWAFEHTCFCAIDLERRFEYVRAIADALQTGGVLACDFLSQSAGRWGRTRGGRPSFWCVDRGTRSTSWPCF